MRAIPIIPILPANDVKIVRPFLVIRFFNDKPKEVNRDIDGFLVLFLPLVCSFGIDNTHATNSGAFTYGTPRRRSLSASSDNGYTEYFDASNSNSIYGASEHVTPINIAVNYFIKVA